uniref:NADH-ubiquinone oxidoreductase chain 5 n=1 Tax=Laternula elliptica TaxID=228457 RepID=A0A1U9XPF6_LATEL|nr:NADH dehydrogenase subunit 5 [Laternula elliptica]
MLRNEAVVCGVSLLLINLTLSLGGLAGGSVMVEWEVFSSGSAFYSLPLLFDWVSFSFSWAVSYIASMVMFFSVGYMGNERYLGRFIWIVFFFVFSMNCLIFIPSIWGIMLGWDGLGVTSFALVVYYQNKKSLAAGMLTALMNRVGDVLIIGVICMSSGQGQWSLCYPELAGLPFAASVCVVVAAMTKSAQFPFCSWLPAAMAAPTPVSALVHSSTLVTAGVYLLIRYSPHLSEVRSGLMFVASCTLILAAIGANLENDLKKIIALSTLSQLGMMMLAIAIGESSLALFHLLSHALFKALLFMCAGAMIHGGGDTQDIRLMGGLWSSMPTTMACFNAANLALCGMPFVGAFYSKDLILEKFLSGELGMWPVLVILIATSLTIFYSTRLSFLVGWGPSNSVSATAYSDEGWQAGAMLGLLGGALLGGAFLQKVFIEFNSFILLCHTGKMIIPLGLFFSLIMTLILNSGDQQLHMKSHFFSSLWFLSFISSTPISGRTLSVSRSSHSYLDQGWMEVGSGQGLHQSLFSAGRAHHKWQSMKITFLIGGGMVAGCLSAVVAL